MIFTTWIILGDATLLLGRPLLGIYTSDPEVVELGMMRMNIMMIAYFTCGTMNVYPSLTRGMGYSIQPMLCTMVGVFFYARRRIRKLAVSEVVLCSIGGS